jgi:hypothetical protein
VNYCTSCGEHFAGVRAFEAHRVGVHAYLYREGLELVPPRYDGRRCLDIEELEANERFGRDADGRWQLVAEAEGARKRLLHMRRRRRSACEPQVVAG